jgi:hypothetical protein
LLIVLGGVLPPSLWDSYLSPLDTVLERGSILWSPSVGVEKVCSLALETRLLHSNFLSCRHSSLGRLVTALERNSGLPHLCAVEYILRYFYALSV